MPSSANLPGPTGSAAIAAKKQDVMKAFSFTYYVNIQEDAQGRFSGYEYGYQEGDTLQIGYRGFISVDSTFEGRSRLESVAHALYARFNHPDMRPAGYRGPSMTIGSVIEIQGVHFAVESLDFKEVEIWQSPISPRDVRWIDAPGPSPEESLLVMKAIR